MNHEILITGISFDWDRFSTAGQLVETIEQYQEQNDLSRNYSEILLCDMPISTNHFDETCIAFLRLNDFRHHRDFIDYPIRLLGCATAS